MQELYIDSKIFNSHRGFTPSCNTREAIVLRYAELYWGTVESNGELNMSAAFIARLNTNND
jgi:hypothetical protein